MFIMKKAEKTMLPAFLLIASKKLMPKEEEGEFLPLEKSLKNRILQIRKKKLKN